MVHRPEAEPPHPGLAGALFLGVLDPDGLVAPSPPISATTPALDELTGLQDGETLRRQADIIAAIRDRPMAGFALNPAVVIEGDRRRPVVSLRIDGSNWTLDTIEAALLAIALRMALDIRASDLFADAFGLASRQAEQKLEALNRFGVVVDLEGEG